MNWWVFGGFLLRGVVQGNPIMGAANGAIAGGLVRVIQREHRRYCQRQKRCHEHGPRHRD